MRARPRTCPSLIIRRRQKMSRTVQSRSDAIDSPESGRGGGPRVWRGWRVVPREDIRLHKTNARAGGIVLPAAGDPLRCAPAMRIRHSPGGIRVSGWIGRAYNGMAASALRGVRWHKSSYSNPNGSCLELAELPDGA